ncbi:MAG TPA: OsmC family protein [Vicinamibacteria bacterium]
MAGRPPTVIDLVWEGGGRLRARAEDRSMLQDWEGAAGPTPVETLAFALAGCMASDVVLILEKGRLPLRGLRVRLTAERAETDPRRFLRVALDFAVEGDLPPDRVARAIALSRETYCSVWHSMRPDIELRTTFSITA